MIYNYGKIDSLTEASMINYMFDTGDNIIYIRQLATDAPVLFIAGDKPISENKWIIPDNIQDLMLKRVVGFPEGRPMLVSDTIAISICLPYNGELDVQLFRRSIFGGIAKAFKDYYGVRLHKTKHQESQFDLCISDGRKIVSEGYAYNHDKQHVIIQANFHISYPMDIAKEIYKPLIYDDGIYNIDQVIVSLEDMNVKYNDSFMNVILSRISNYLDIDMKMSDNKIDISNYIEINNDTNWILEGVR